MGATNWTPVMKVTTGIPFTDSAPELSLPRRAIAPVLEHSPSADLAASLEAERRRLEEDARVLAEREENLRQYEGRLRALQSEMDQRTGSPGGRSSAPFPPGRSSTNPFPNDAALDAAWQKLHRARELCEAEQAHLRDDRIAMHAFDLELKQREEMVAGREARVAEQERLLAAATPAAPAASANGDHAPSAFRRFTRAPFLMAESVLRGKNGKDKTEE
jgi:hypothetical protein